MELFEDLLLLAREAPNATDRNHRHKVAVSCHDPSRRGTQSGEMEDVLGNG